MTIHGDHFLLDLEALKEIYSEAGVTLRREQMKMGGRPQTSDPRCPCGAMTAKRAAARAHKCDESGPILVANRRGIYERRKAK
jgi:hypothetical protein